MSVQVVFRKKRLVVMKEMLPTRPWEHGSPGREHPPLWGGFHKCCSHLVLLTLLLFALSEPCPSPPGVWTQSEVLSWP